MDSSFQWELQIWTFTIFFISFEQCLELQFSFSVKFEINNTEVFEIRYFILFFCFIHENIKKNMDTLSKIEEILRLPKVRFFLQCSAHRDAFCQYLFQRIYYCHSSKSTGKETAKRTSVQWPIIPLKKFNISISIDISIKTLHFYA